MKKVLILLSLLSIFIITACSSVPMQTPTIESAPTSTSKPTKTVTPTPSFTPLPTQTSTPTQEINLSATSTMIAKKQEHFSNEVKRIFAEFACASAIWEDKSFSLACVNVNASNYEDLRLIAYRMTNVFALQWKDMELNQCFEDDFYLSLALMSNNQEFIIEATTSGKLLERFLENNPITQDIWEVESKIITNN